MIHEPAQRRAFHNDDAEEWRARVRLDSFFARAGDVFRSEPTTRPGALSRPAPDDALREWIVSARVNRAGAGDDDPALIEPIEHA
jgi:hypothetical protein